MERSILASPTARFAAAKQAAIRARPTGTFPIPRKNFARRLLWKVEARPQPYAVLEKKAGRQKTWRRRPGPLRDKRFRRLGGDEPRKQKRAQQRRQCLPSCSKSSSRWSGRSLSRHER